MAEKEAERRKELRFEWQRERMQSLMMKIQTSGMQILWRDDDEPSRDYDDGDETDECLRWKR